MELKKVTDNVSYIANATNLGVINDGHQAILVDSGLDDDTGRRVLKILVDNGLKLVAVINTHAHADHCGANNFLIERTGAAFYAPEIEADIIQHPLIQPLAFFSFANPLEELKNKFMMSKPSRIDWVIDSKQPSLAISGFELKVVALPGHSINQIGLEYGGVLFCADSLLSKELLAKHRLPVNFDVDKQMATLSFLQSSHYQFYIPSHVTPGPDLSDILKVNLQHMVDTRDCIYQLLDQPYSTDELLRKFFDALKIELKGVQHYFLLRSAALAYLSSLAREGKIKPAVEGNSLLWARVH
jgi:glyoxylase-like metal-dependent hydrolase (beta-lactamase superfamily II)